MSSRAWGLCDRCSFRKRDSELRCEWTNLRVCRDCFDPRPPWLDPPSISPLEGMPVPDARYDQDATNPNFIDTDNPVDPNDL